MTTPTKTTGIATGKPSPILSSCPTCDTAINIHLGPPFEIADLSQGEPYAMSELPRDSRGDHVLVCLDCAREAQMILDAGHPYFTDVLREAKDRKLRYIVERTSRPPAPESRVRSAESDETPWPFSPDDIDRVTRFENALLLENYAQVHAERERELEAKRRLHRRRNVGLHVVETELQDPRDDGIPF